MLARGVHFFVLAKSSRRDTTRPPTLSKKTLAEAEEMVFEGGLDEKVEREDENDDDCISFHEFVESIVAVHESEVEVEASDLSMHRIASTVHLIDDKAERRLSF